MPAGKQQTIHDTVEPVLVHRPFTHKHFALFKGHVVYNIWPGKNKITHTYIMFVRGWEGLAMRLVEPPNKGHLGDKNNNHNFSYNFLNFVPSSRGCTVLRGAHWTLWAMAGEVQALAGIITIIAQPYYKHRLTFSN